MFKISFNICNRLVAKRLFSSSLQNAPILDFFKESINLCNNVEEIKDIIFDPKFDSIQSLDTFSDILAKIKEFQWNANVNDIEHHFNLLLKGQLNVKFMNTVLDFKFSLNDVRETLLAYSRTYGIVPDEETFRIVLDRSKYRISRGLENCPSFVESTQWMISNLNFKPTNECFKIISRLRADTRELVMYLANQGLNFPIEAMKPFIFRSKNKIECIKKFKLKYNLNLDDKVLAWYVVASQPFDPIKLIEEFQNHFNVEITGVALKSMIATFLIQRKLPEFCQLALKANEKYPLGKDFGINFLHRIKDRIDQKHFIHRACSIAVVLRQLYPGFSTQFLEIFQSMIMNDDDIAHYNIRSIDDCNLQMVPTLPQNYLLDAVICNKRDENFILFWKVLQVMKVEPIYYYRFVNNVSRYASKQTMDKLKNEEKYIELFGNKS